MKKRLDVLLVERGLAESRARAQALVLAGLVHGYDKPGQQVDDDAELEVERPPPYVSRGGEKLAHGLDRLGVDAAGLDCVDVGASTRGFTDVLLQRGAARVIAIDVGYGQLHPKLRADPRGHGDIDAPAELLDVEQAAPHRPLQQLDDVLALRVGHAQRSLVTHSPDCSPTG